MTIEELLVEAEHAVHEFWFVRSLDIVERTAATVTLHFHISSDLFVQAFLSNRSNRLSFALVGPAGRLYGRDREHGAWHRHPFDEPHTHEPTPEGISPQPLRQFLSEVEQILVDNELI